MAAGLAWYIAHTLLGHHQPFFAPTAAAVSLSKNQVLRGQRAVQLIAGVLLGIGIGSAVRSVAGPTPGGSGSVAVGAAAAIALVLALAVGGGFFEQGVLLVNQSVTAAILMIAVVGAATGPERLFDALIGGGVALVITVLLFPAAPLPLIQHAAGEVCAALRDTLAELAGPGMVADPAWALTAGQRIQARLGRLREGCSAARQVASFAPRRWPQRPRVRQACEQAAPLHLFAATVISLAHASAAGPASQPSCPAVPEALSELASAFAALAGGSGTDAARSARHATWARALVTGATQAGSPHERLIATLTQTCAEDILKFVR